MSSNTVRLTVGQLLGGRYRIERELGEVGWGCTWRPMSRCAARGSPPASGSTCSAGDFSPVSGARAAPVRRITGTLPVDSRQQGCTHHSRRMVMPQEEVQDAGRTKHESTGVGRGFIGRTLPRLTRALAKERH
jgi:hypothetical protein